MTRIVSDRPLDRASRRTFLLPIVCALALIGCGDEDPDAYGNFEAEEVTVSAEIGGRLLRFEPAEGQPLVAGAVVGQIDSATLALQRRELMAQQRAAHTRAIQAEAQVGVLRAQLSTAREEYGRTRRLYEAEAATAQQLNQMQGEVRVLEEQIEAALAQAAAAHEEVGGVQARIAQVGEQIENSRIVNPLTGTVLTTYVEAGEFAQPGMPLYRIADLGTLTLRAYVSGAQLARVRLGQRVQVRFDAGDGELEAVPGRLTWIASEAEFTPTPIQTRDERTDLVYAVTVSVPNPSGAMKIGMPGEVYFTEES